MFVLFYFFFEALPAKYLSFYIFYSAMQLNWILIGRKVLIHFLTQQLRHFFK